MAVAEKQDQEDHKFITLKLVNSSVVASHPDGGIFSDHFLFPLEAIAKQI